jgi:hypothetical protein
VVALGQEVDAGPRGQVERGGVEAGADIVGVGDGSEGC